MKEKEQLDYNESLDSLVNDLQHFIELSFHHDEISINEWLSKITNKIDGHCWEKKQCKCKDGTCPAYQNENRRCWLIAGTMCDGKVEGKFAQKFESCTECDFFNESVGTEQISKLKELVIVLIHSLQQKKANLEKALSEIKVLSGFIPICASCKKIRDDKGYWNQIEVYIRDHSEAKFTHSICPTCATKLYPDIIRDRADK